MSEFEWLGVLRAGGVDLERNDHPVCPHCGEECKIDDYELWDLHEEGEHTTLCPTCDMEFNVTSHARWSFSTDEQDGV